MDLVVFDLEWNSCFEPRSETFINEIIEWGAVKLNEQLEITDTFQMLVKPVIGKRIRGKVRDLTSLTLEELQQGVPFAYSVGKFRKFCKGCLLMTWSKTDLLALSDNLAYHTHSRTIDFLQQYVDLQQYCQERLGRFDSHALGLQAAAEMLQIDTEQIQYHRALGDSYVSAMCLKKLYHPAMFQSYVQDAAQPEFYRRLFFKQTILKDPDSPLIHWDEVFFNCIRCGARAQRTSDWHSANGRFRAQFVCPLCGTEFTGKTLFKLRLDGVTVQKRVSRSKAGAQEEEEEK